MADMPLKSTMLHEFCKIKTAAVIPAVWQVGDRLKQLTSLTYSMEQSPS